MRSRQLQQASICQFSTSSWSFSEDIARYRNHGFETIGVWRRKLDEYGIERAIDLLYESKMRVSSLHWAGGFTGDGQSFNQAIEDTYQAIHTAARINADCLLLHPGARNGHIRKHIDGVFRSALTQLVPVAEDLGVTLAIEPMPNHVDSPWTFYHQFEETLELLDAFPALRLVLDLYHVGFESEVYERLPEIADSICLVQLADRTLASWQASQDWALRRQCFRRPAGTGCVDIAKWVQQLQAVGYQGAWEFEVHGVDQVPKCHFRLLEQTMKFLRSPQALPTPQPATETVAAWKRSARA